MTFLEKTFLLKLSQFDPMPETQDGKKQISRKSNFSN